MTDFTLTNYVKPSERQKAPKAREHQRQLFSGLDCPPGTRDLLPDLDAPAITAAEANELEQLTGMKQRRAGQ